MYVVMGATGGVGGAVAGTLLDAGEDVTVVTRDAARARPLAERGASVAVADLADPDSLRSAFRRGRRAFLLAPLGDVTADVDAGQRRASAAVLAALQGSGLEKVVLASTYGARRGERIGDLGTLFELERSLTAQGIPVAIDRGAYYFSNWAMVLEPVRTGGVLPTMLPADLRIPMVASHDVGVVAADRLRSGVDDVGTRWVEGPAEYSAAEVARAFSLALGRDVRVEVVPRGRWLETFRSQGFSEASAESFAGMTSITVDDREPAEHPIRGTTTLEQYIRALVG